MKRLSRWAIAAAIALLPSAVIASSVISETIEELAHNAPMIVRGRVGQVQPQLDERYQRIYTYSDLQVTEVFKGPKVASVLIKTPGGEIAGRGQRVAGAERFSPGEDTILFLEPAVDEAGVYILRTLAAGKVNLEPSKLGELRARRHLEGLAFYGNRGAVQVLAPPQDDLGPAEAFLARVRAALKGGGR